MKQLKEGTISAVGDLFYAFRFLKLLTTPWEKMKAYELGVIDGNGVVQIKPKDRTQEMKNEYTVFHKLVFNLKRLLEKLPFGKTKLASYATALFLIKEHTGMSEKQLRKTIEKVLGEPLDDLNESTWFESENGLGKGTYTLTNDIASPETGDIIAHKNTKVVVESTQKPTATVFGCNIYKVHHPKTNQSVYVTNGDITR